jgi:hypothetical protein
MPFKNRCPASRMFYKRLTKHFKGFGYGFTKLQAKVGAEAMLEFVIHCRQN